MLGKLLKYDFKALFKIIFPFYGALLAITAVSRILSELGWNNPDVAVQNIIYALTTVVYVFTVIGVILTAIVLVVTRFYKNIVGDEGYLMFTLPVAPNTLLLSKLISAVVFFICNIGAIVLSIILLIPFKELSVIFGVISSLMSSAAGVILLMILAILVAIITNTLIVYTAMSAGQHITQNRLVGSILAYIGIYVSIQIVMLIGMLIGFFTFGGQFQSLATIDESGIVTIVFIALIAFLSALGALLYFVTRHFLTKKLNLQ